MSNEQIISALKEIVAKIVLENYEDIYKEDFSQEMKPEMIKYCLDDYRGNWTIPPAESYRNLDVAGPPEEVNVNFRLWDSSEESDLSLRCRLKVIGGKVRYTLIDLRIL